MEDIEKRKEEALRLEINRETARYPWRELLRFFATGSVVAVSPELDLVEVAVRIARDDKAAVEAWLRTGLVERVGDAQAQAWLEADSVLWTVVVKPWILVQDRPQAAPAGVQLH